ncbi:hypothetical protein H2200_012646 [Cladophialophora chaetospira]|uniref:Xylanolytic transcriptional activator regulatory domain-containing protein n=1 Tax=Cladophialophora chaetospira TaxID=386627 RepID=A0AA38WXC5_9EURO|nr:hypothetical protein H2200_012646 [Cladophialophora chaetospira]
MTLSPPSRPIKSTRPQTSALRAGENNIDLQNGATSINSSIADGFSQLPTQSELSSNDPPARLDALHDLDAGTSPSESCTSPSLSRSGASRVSVETSQSSVAPLPDSNEDLFPDFTTSLLPGTDPDDITGSTEQQASRDIIQEGPDRVGSRNWQKFLPCFIRPITSQRTYSYHDFLKSKDAFSIPALKLRNAIISRYVEFVYPQLPVIELHDVLNAVATNGKKGKISLLLFQSILLAGSAYVDIEYVFEAGYRSRLALREQLAERVRLLYDFDCETDRLILVQSLILMTSWQEKGDEVKHLRHWISVAHNIALLLGLNRDPYTLPIPAGRKRLWKRIWWSLYLRDRTLALGLRQSPLIASSECVLPDLDRADFEIQTAEPEVCSTFTECGLLRDLDQQERLVEVCIAQLKLSHHLSDILQARYTTYAPKMGCTKLNALVLVPKPPAVDADDVQTCSRDIDQWWRELPEHMKYRSRLSLSFDPGQGVLMLHCSILNMFYYALVCALHRPYPSPILRSLSASETCFQRKSLHAADAIMSILGELQVHDLICFLPTQGITMMMQAAITFLGDSNSSTAFLQTRSQQSLEACLQILQIIRDVHTYSFWATNLLTTAASKLYQRCRGVKRILNVSPGIEETANYAMDGSDAGHGVTLSPASLREKSRLIEGFELSGDHGANIIAQHTYEEPIGDFEYPDFIDPYLTFEHSGGMDLFLDLDWSA